MAFGALLAPLFFGFAAFFGLAADFYGFWRHSTRSWKKSPEAERLLRRALEERDP